MYIPQKEGSPCTHVPIYHSSVLREHKREHRGESPHSKNPISLVLLWENRRHWVTGSTPGPWRQSNVGPRAWQWPPTRPQTAGIISTALPPVTGVPSEHFTTAPGPLQLTCLFCTAEPIIMVHSQIKQEPESSLMGWKLVKAVSPMQLVKPVC